MGNFMLNQHPYPEYEGKRNIVAGILLSIITCGIYGLYWQYKQMATLNAWLKRDEYSFWLWFFLSIITCGIFGIYYEYKMANGINSVQADNDLVFDVNLPIICVLLAIFGIGIASLAVQQHQINRLYDQNSNA
jgi:hypothetical protein